MNNDETKLAHDWYDGSIPPNVALGEGVYLDSTYAFDRYCSQQPLGLELGKGSGAYDRATFVVGPRGRVTVGKYSCLNGCYLVCHQQISIGAHCLLAWGSVITDGWLDCSSNLTQRRAAVMSASENPQRWMDDVCRPRPVTIADNVWIGFDAVVLPGVTLGQGCIVGCKSVVTEDIPAYAIYVGNPGRIVRYLRPDDTAEARQLAFQEHLRA